MRLRGIGIIQVAQGLSSFGTSVSTIALSFMVFKLTGSVLQFGGVMAAGSFPLVAMSPLSGALLDRFSARNLMITADCGRAILILAMPFLAEQGVAFIYVVSALVGVLSSLFSPSQIRLIGDMAEDAELVSANSWLSVIRDGSELSGYLSGAVLVTALGYSVTFGVDALTYLISGVLLLTLPRTVHPDRGSASLKLILQETPQAACAMWRRPGLRTNLLLASLGAVSIMMCIPNENALVLKIFDRGAPGLAALEIFTSAGMIIGGLMVSRMRMLGDKNGYVAFSLVAMGACFLLIGLSPLFWVSVALMGLGGMANVLTFVPSMTLFQQLPNDSMKGRLIATRTGLGQLGATVGLLLGGGLGSSIGVRHAFLVAGGIGVILTLFFYLPYRASLMRRKSAAWNQAIEAGATRSEARMAAVAALAGLNDAARGTAASSTVVESQSEYSLTLVEPDEGA